MLQIGGQTLDTNLPLLQINSTTVQATSRVVRDLVQFGMPVLQVTSSSSRTLQVELSTTIVAGKVLVMTFRNASSVDFFLDS